MALLPNNKIYGTTGNNSSPTEKIGGVVVGITSATDTTNGQPITLTFPTLNNSVEVVRSLPRQLNGAGHAVNATGVRAGGTFAYDQVAYMVRGIATTINGTANTALLYNGNEQHKKRTPVSVKRAGAKTSTAMRAGYWNPLGISGQRVNWSTSPATANGNYVLPTNNSSPAVDEGIFVTYRTVPGELVYMYGAINPLQDEYPAR